jgi:hypothetical protein
MTRDEIERRRDELMGERSRTAFRVPMPTEAAVLAHNAQLDRIDAELAALPAAEIRDTGEAAGIVEISRGFLGDPWSAPPPREEAEPPWFDDPIYREYGDSIL